MGAAGGRRYIWRCPLELGPLADKFAPVRQSHTTFMLMKDTLFQLQIRRFWRHVSPNILSALVVQDLLQLQVNVTNHADLCISYPFICSPLPCVLMK